MFQQDQARIQQEGRKAGSALRVHQVLQKRPIASLQEMARTTGLSFAAAAAGMKLLEQLDIVCELTGKKRNRLFGHQQYLNVLAEESEAL